MLVFRRYYIIGTNFFMFFKFKKLNKKGFSLIEILVSVGLFAVIIVACSKLFALTIAGQRFTLRFQDVLNETSYVMEYMSKAIRMGKKELNCASKSDPSSCNCLQNKGYGYNYEINEGKNQITFVNYNQRCQRFYLDVGEGVIKEALANSAAGLTDSANIADLTSDDLLINSFKFNLFGDGQYNNYQPRVTMFLDVERQGEEHTEVKVQTSVSQRNLDVKY